MSAEELVKELLELRAFARLQSTRVDPAARLETAAKCTEFVRRHGLRTLFAILATAAVTASEQLGALCEIADVILSTAAVLSSLPADDKLADQVIAALVAPAPEVQQLALRLIRDTLAGQRQQAAPLTRAVLHSEPLRKAVTSCLASDSPAVTDCASHTVLVMCGITPVATSAAGPVPTHVPASTSASAAAAAAAATATYSASTPFPRITPTPEEVTALLLDVQAVYDAAASREQSEAVACICALIVQVAAASEATVAAADDAGLLRSLAAVLDGEDVLLQATVLDVLPAVARTAGGLTFLVGSRTLHTLAGWAGMPVEGAGAGGSEEDPMLGPSALSAVADVYHNALVCDWAAGSAALRSVVVPPFLGLVSSRCSQSVEASTTIAALSALSVVARMDPVLVHQLVAGDALSRFAAREWLECGVSSDPEVRYAALAALAAILHTAPAAVSAMLGATAAASASASSAAADGSEDPFARYVSLFIGLGSACGRDPVDVLMFSLKHTAAEEARHAAYDVAAALAALPGTAGLRLLFSAPGFGGYMLDNSTEHSKQGMEWKFGVVVAATTNPAVGILGSTYLTQLRKYRERGAYAGAAPVDAVEVATV